jgi:hypothetical protein
LPPRSLVLPGSQVFDVFFEGTRFDDTDVNGKYVKSSLKEEWPTVSKNFENILADVADIQSDNQKTNIELWFETLKKVVKFWESY